MAKRLNLTGEKYGGITVLEYDSNDKFGHSKWKCICSCGKEFVAIGDNLKRHHYLSCGCKNPAKTGDISRTHGMTNTRFYNIWDNMKRRCQNKNNKSFSYYGGRGITVCEKWESFDGFCKDMYDTYSEKMTLERVDVNSGYFKENCTWIPHKMQSRNKRNTVKIYFNGTLIPFSEYCEINNLEYNKVRYELKKENKLVYANEVNL